MSICIIALIVFAVLGIFSAKYRRWAKEAFSCVGRRLTLRACESSFNQRMKAKITSKLMGKSHKLAKFTSKYFEPISWAFTIILFLSIFFTVSGLYNVLVYENCDGEDSTGFCIFNPEATGELGHSVGEGVKGELLPTSPDDDPFIGSKDAKVTVIEFGCYACPYTKKAEYVRKNIVEQYGNKVKFVFRNFPLPTHELSMELAEASECADEQGKFWEYHDILFENQKIESVDKIKELARETGLNMDEFNNCYDSGKLHEEVEADHQDGIKSGIYGTPTFFINGRPLVGPRNWNEFKTIIDQELAK